MICLLLQCNNDVNYCVNDSSLGLETQLEGNHSMRLLYGGSTNIENSLS